MNLSDAYNALLTKVNVPFGQYMTAEQLSNIEHANNKGIVGQIIEDVLGLPHTSTLLDFDDGELKTNKCNHVSPVETIAVTQISTGIDDLLDNVPFEDSRVFNKIRNMLLVPMDKASNDVRQWKILACFVVSYDDPTYQRLFEQIKRDYISICNEVRQRLMPPSNGMLHTESGIYLQIRTKDSKPYTPIYSTTLDRDVSNKQYAFYFRKTLMKELLQGLPGGLQPQL